MTRNGNAERAGRHSKPAPRDSLFLVLSLALALLAQCSSAAADCSSQCSFYSRLVAAAGTATGQCLLDCANCVAANDGNGQDCKVFSPKFNSTGGYTNSVCEDTCNEEGLPAWAIVAISLGSLAILGVIACATFGFILRMKRLKVEAIKARSQLQQQQPQQQQQQQQPILTTTAPRPVDPRNSGMSGAPLPATASTGPEKAAAAAPLLPTSMPPPPPMYPTVGYPAVPPADVAHVMTGYPGAKNVP